MGKEITLVSIGFLSPYTRILSAELRFVLSGKMDGQSTDSPKPTELRTTSVIYAMLTPKAQISILLPPFSRTTNPEIGQKTTSRTINRLSI